MGGGRWEDTLGAASTSSSAPLTGQDDGAAAYPHVVTDGDGLGKLQALDPRAQRRVDAMSNRIEVHVRCQDDTVPDGNRAFVQKAAAEVGIEILACLSCKARQGRGGCSVCRPASRRSMRAGLHIRAACIESHLPTQMLYPRSHINGGSKNGGAASSIPPSSSFKTAVLASMSV